MNDGHVPVVLGIIIFNTSDLIESTFMEGPPSGSLGDKFSGEGRPLVFSFVVLRDAFVFIKLAKGQQTKTKQESYCGKIHGCAGENAISNIPIDCPEANENCYRWSAMMSVYHTILYYGMISNAMIPVLALPNKLHCRYGGPDYVLPKFCVDGDA